MKLLFFAALWLFVSQSGAWDSILPISIDRSLFAYREVNITIDECNIDVCDIADAFRSYPNLAFFLSLEPDWTFHGNSDVPDLIASYVSSVGFPSTVVCYFHSDATYNLEIDWDAFLRGEPGSVKLGSGYFCLGFVVERIIEYVDLDNDDQYIPENDEIVSQFNFLVQGVWQKAVSKTEGNVYYLNATTKDGIISLQWTSSPVVVKEKTTDFVITPNATRLEFEILNFPFTKGRDTKLALKGFVATDGVEDEYFKEETTDSESHLLIGTESNQGYFSWGNEVEVSFQDDDGVQTTAIAKVITNFYNHATNIPGSGDYGLIKAIFGTSATIRDVYISFGAVNQPQYLKWYSASGYGQPPKSNLIGDLLITGGIFLTLLIPAIIIFAVVRCRATSQSAAMISETEQESDESQEDGDKGKGKEEVENRKDNSDGRPREIQKKKRPGKQGENAEDFDLFGEYKGKGEIRVVEKSPSLISTQTQGQIYNERKSGPSLGKSVSPKNQSSSSLRDPLLNS